MARPKGRVREGRDEGVVAHQFELAEDLGPVIERQAALGRKPPDEVAIEVRGVDDRAAADVASDLGARADPVTAAKVSGARIHGGRPYGQPSVGVITGRGHGRGEEQHNHGAAPVNWPSPSRSSTKGFVKARG